MMTDRTGSRATWRSLAVATPIASALFLGSLAWAVAVVPDTGATANANSAPATSAPATSAPANGNPAPAPSQAPATHATSGASA